MYCWSHSWQRRQLQRGKGHSSRWAIAGILGSSLWSLSCIWADTLVYTLCKALLHPLLLLLLLLKLQTQPKCTFTETGNKTSLKTLSRGGRCTETKEEGAVLHSRALQPSATKPQIAPTWNCKRGQASRVTKGKVRVQFKSVQTLSNCPPKNGAALKPNRNGFTSVSERDNSVAPRAKVPLTLAPNGQNSVKEETLLLWISTRNLWGLFGSKCSWSWSKYLPSNSKVTQSHV